MLQPYYQVKIAVTNFQAQNGVDVSVALQGHKGPGYSLGYNGSFRSGTGQRYFWVFPGITGPGGLLNSSESDPKSVRDKFR